MLSKKHELIRKLAKEFAENELAPFAAQVDETGEYPKWGMRRGHLVIYHSD